MIFADKLIQLRKKSGWSQEELAQQMNVSRQSVSKWEGAQSVPDLDKILKLSQLFGVTTDYLLKDEIGETETVSQTQEQSALRRVSMEEADAFLRVKAETAPAVAWGVCLCILSPICLLLLGAISEIPSYGISKNLAGGLGMIILLLMVAAAVAVFIWVGSKTERFSYLEKEIFETEYGVEGMVRQRREEYRDSYTKSIILGTILCVLALVPIFVGVCIHEDNDLFMVEMLCMGFALVAFGVLLMVRKGILWECFHKLLQEGEYSPFYKKQKISLLSSCYWLLVTAVFLAYSFYTMNWHRSWIIWPVAGVIYQAALAAYRAFSVE